MPIAPRADVKVGFSCNNRCVFCAQGEKRRSCGVIPFFEIEARLRSVRVKGRGLVLTGGEPTLHRDILRIVATAAAMGFSPIQIQTNGRLFAYPEVIDRLVRAGATEFSPSLHGSRAELHDALTRAPGSFAETTRGIANLVSKRQVLVTNTVITKENLYDLPATVLLLALLGVRQAQLAFVHPVGTAAEQFERVVPRLSDLAVPLRAAYDVARRHRMQLRTEAIPPCFLEGMEALAVECEIPPMTVVDVDGVHVDFSAWRTNEGKAHGPPCERCPRRAGCEGPWREYPAAFGWDEFEQRTGGSSGRPTSL